VAVKYLGPESMPTLKPSEGMSGVSLTEATLVYHTLPTTYIIGNKNCAIILNNMAFIYCSWVFTRWQWSVNLHKNDTESYTQMKK
jgi:hypothetical protein